MANLAATSVLVVTVICATAVVRVRIVVPLVLVVTAVRRPSMPAALLLASAEPMAERIRPRSQANLLLLSRQLLPNRAAPAARSCRR